MRLSNGTSILFGSDSSGHAVVFDGIDGTTTLSDSPEWKLDVESGSPEDRRRCWRIPLKKTLERPTNQCPEDYLLFLQQEIGKLSPEGLHPALINGLEMEAERLFPKISEEGKNQFKSFISLLKNSFQIDEEQECSKLMSNFVDDIGPTLLVLIDQKPSILPEIPSIYLAPNDWSLAMWRINNHMVGPLLVENVEDQDKIQFLGLSLASNELSERQKGIYYFHMARFILFFEAWTENPDVPHLLEFIRLFRKGIRFLEKLP